MASARCAISWPVVIRLLFRRGELLAAAFLCSAEAEEQELAAVFEDEVDCMGFILWLSGVLI